MFICVVNIYIYYIYIYIYIYYTYDRATLSQSQLRSVPERQMHTYIIGVYYICNYTCTSKIPDHDILSGRYCCPEREHKLNSCSQTREHPCTKAYCTTNHPNVVLIKKPQSSTKQPFSKGN